MSPANSMERRLRTSGLLVIAGFLVEACCLLWSRPIAFIVLVGLGGLLIVAGVLFFLHSLVFVHPDEGGKEKRKEQGG